MDFEQVEQKKPKRIRYCTWYWGKWVWEGSKVDGTIVTVDTPGFEEYIEGKHSLQE